MAEGTLQRPRSPGAAPAGAFSLGSRHGRGTSGGVLVAGAVGLALLALSTGLVLWARTRPGFDAYGWLVWGHQTLTGSLNTNAAPSWKPLPFLFTVPYALAGHYQLWLWMITSVGISLSGVVFAARIAYLLTLGRGRGPAAAQAPERKRRYAALLAAAFAGVSLLGIRDYAHYVLSAQSDPMIVSLCLAAIDCHLCGRRRLALVLGALAALGRPEVWPFFGLYAVWAWRRVPELRLLIAALVVAILALWFGIPALSSRSPFVAGTNALGSGRALHKDRVLGTVDRFLDLHETPLELLALLSAGIAVWRRDRATIALAGAAVAWVIVEIAFALHGWPGLPRYMFEAAGLTVVVAAVGFGRLTGATPLLRTTPQPRSIAAAAGVLGIAVAALVVVALTPAAVSRARTERADLKVQRRRTAEINRLAGVIGRLGGAARLRSCGEPLTRLEYQTLLAWQLRVNVAQVGFKYLQAIARGDPIVLFTPEPDGWKVQALHQRLPSCRALPR